ncbi:MAG TPA: CPBP family glutamic-type intramembrane protease [Nitrososphaerales archaeon]|nr:CPBP family glutamic-type intramembrane protease [Nitrososphaerales archaeon]
MLPEEQQRRGLLSTAFMGVFLVLLLFTVALIVLSFPVGWYAVFSGSLSKVFNSGSLSRPYLWIGPLITYLPFSVPVGGVFAGLSVIYLGMFVLSVRQGSNPIRAMSMSLKEGEQPLFSSPFIVAVITIAFLTFTASVMDAFISSTGVQIGTITGDPLALLAGFTSSPLVEELGFRVVLIGLVAMILCLGRSTRTALKALWRPSAAIEGLAVGSGASILIWVATGFSAVTFGACHVLCGSTWDIGKFPEAAYGGLVLGYVYVKYGLHVAVLAHWGVDYLGSVFAFFGQAAYGIPWNTTSNEFLGQYLVDIDMLILFGLASFVLIMYVGIKRIVTARKGPEVQAGMTVEPV